MARRLPGDEAHHYRRSDHAEEISGPAHDETGISLDEWLSARVLVETLIGKPILENEV